jgi:hypothetical protein
MMIEALARAYDHVVIDAGTAQDGATERLCRLARRAVLVATDAAAPATRAARDRLLAVGFGDVALLDGAANGMTAAAA